MRHQKILLAATTLAAAAALTLAGCTGTDSTSKNTASPRADSTSTAAPQLPGQTPGVTGATDVPTKLKNVAAKRSAVIVKDCKATKKGWQAAGTVKNAGKKSAEYAITVFFTDTNSTVVAWQQTTATADAGKTAKWAAAADFTAPSDTNCVIAAVS